MTAGISLLVPIYRCTTKMGNLVLGVTACAIVSPYLQGICSKNPSGCFKLKIVWLYIYIYEWVSEVAQSFPTLCDPMDCSLPGSFLHGILQARVLEWVAISVCRGSSWPRDPTWVSHIPGRRFNLWATREALYQLSSVQFSCSVMSYSLRPHESQHARPPCPSPTPGVHSDSHPSSWWCHPAISSSVIPFPSCPQSLPASESFPNESTLRMRWPKYWSYSFSIIPSKEHPGLISFRMDWLDLLAVQGTLKSLLQHHSSKASILWCSAFFTVQLSHPYMTTGRTIAFIRRTFDGKVMSLFFNMLPRLVITFLPRSVF